MIFDYGTLISPNPIKLSIGSLKKPKLIEIGEITFSRFYMYETFLKITPEEFYKSFYSNEKIKTKNSSLNLEKENLTMYDIIINDINVQNLYCEILNFFFIENIYFKDKVFIILKEDVTIIDLDSITEKDIKGIIYRENFLEILDMIQQICCINSSESSESKNLKFRDEYTRKLWEKLEKSRIKNEKKKKKSVNINLVIPNIISAVSSKSCNLNINTIWNITIYQLYDQFARLQNNDIYGINSLRLAVWGDEKNTFDSSLWYKNIFNKQ